MRKRQEYTISVASMIARLSANVCDAALGACRNLAKQSVLRVSEIVSRLSKSEFAGYRQIDGVVAHADPPK